MVARGLIAHQASFLLAVVLASLQTEKEEDALEGHAKPTDRDCQSLYFPLCPVPTSC